MNSTNRDLQTDIDIVKKECEAYPENNTLHSENVANITINSDSVTPQKKKNGREEDHQEDHQIFQIRV